MEIEIEKQHTPNGLDNLENDIQRIRYNLNQVESELHDRSKDWKAVLEAYRSQEKADQNLKETENKLHHIKKLRKQAEAILKESTQGVTTLQQEFEISASQNENLYLEDLTSELNAICSLIEQLTGLKRSPKTYKIILDECEKLKDRRIFVETHFKKRRGFFEKIVQTIDGIWPLLQKLNQQCNYYENYDFDLTYQHIREAEVCIRKAEELKNSKNEDDLEAAVEHVQTAVTAYQRAQKQFEKSQGLIATVETGYRDSFDREKDRKVVGDIVIRLTKQYEQLDFSLANEFIYHVDKYLSLTRDNYRVLKRKESNLEELANGFDKISENLLKGLISITNKLRANLSSDLEDVQEFIHSKSLRPIWLQEDLRNIRQFLQGLGKREDSQETFPNKFDQEKTWISELEKYQRICNYSKGFMLNVISIEDNIENLRQFSKPQNAEANQQLNEIIDKIQDTLDQAKRANNYSKYQSLIKQANFSLQQLREGSIVFGDYVMKKISVTNSQIENFVVADKIQNSFNKIASADVSQELKDLLNSLALEIEKMSKVLSDETAQELAQDLDVLTTQATSKSPNKRWLKVSVEGIKTAAKNIGEIGKPVLELVSLIISLLKLS